MENLFPHEIKWTHVPESDDFNLVETRRLALVHFARDVMPGQQYLARTAESGRTYGTLEEALRAAYDAGVYKVYDEGWL